MKPFNSMKNTIFVGENDKCNVALRIRNINHDDTYMGKEFAIPTFTPADIMGAFIILVLVIGIFVLMWFDYRRYLDEQVTKYRRQPHTGFSLKKFVKREQLYIFLFLMFLFLIGGEMLLYDWL